MEKSTEKKDIFYLDKVFPDASRVFSEEFKDAAIISRDAIYILDTNVLLVPFDTTEKNLKEIKSIYERYKAKNRLYIPARVAREFAHNRATKIGEVFLQIRQLKDNLNSGMFKINQYPILDTNPSYIALLKQFEEIQQGIKNSRKLLDSIETDIQSWTWNDNVSRAYKEVFTHDIVIEVEKRKEDIERDLSFRIEYKVAPGYKDSKKLDDGVGDLVIWQTILEISKKFKRDVVFVTNDQKNDWFYRQDKVSLYPKYELFDEFRRFTGGNSISIINFVKFLEISNANSETIDQVKNTIEESLFTNFSGNSSVLTPGLTVEHPKFGIGQIQRTRMSGATELIEIIFKEFGLKTLLVQFAKLRIVDNRPSEEVSGQ